MNTRFMQGIRRVVIVGGVLIILFSLAWWGGTVTPGPLFLLGVAILSSLIVAFGVLTAWLYHAPPPSVSIPSRAAGLRQTLAVLILGSTTFFTIGGFWDEVWHRRYGGFGDDFLWPPHLLIYVSLLMMALFAGGGLWLTFRNQGGIRERFRAEAHIGLIGLVCTFLVVSLPSDELWHRIYGKDITAWSLPHIIIAAGTITVAFVASHLARREFPSTNRWHTLRGWKSHELIALWLIAIGTVMWLQLGVAEWDGIQSIPSNTLLANNAFWRRPEWLYPVVVGSIALFSSTFALATLNRIGAATGVALSVVAFRLLCLSVFSVEGERVQLGYISHVLLMPPALALDGWYFFHRYSTDTGSLRFKGHLLAAIIFLLVGLPGINALLIYPRITQITLPAMVGMTLLMSLIMGWAGEHFSQWLGTLAPYPTEGRSSKQAQLYLLIGLGFMVIVLLTILITAEPPQS